MQTYTTTKWKAKLGAATVTIAIAALLLEWVASGFLYPAPEALAVRKAVIEAQAAQVEKSREFSRGAVKAADARMDPQLQRSDDRKL